MKLLLTSAGMTNASITRELRRMLRRPTAESSVVVVLTAALAEPCSQSDLLADLRDLHRVGWRQIGLADLATQQPSQILRQLADADAVYLASGDPYRLRYWLDTLAPSGGLPNTAVTIAAGPTCSIFSRDMPHRLSALGVTGHDGIEPARSRNSGGLPWLVIPKVDFDRWDPRLAEAADFPVFAIDDETAISVNGQEVAVVSEGRWRYLPGSIERTHRQPGPPALKLVPTLGESVLRGSEGIRWPEALAIRE